MVKELLSYLFSPELQELLFPVRIIFLGFFVFFFISTIWFFLTTSWFRKIFWQDFYEILTYRGFWGREASKNWKKIIGRLKKRSESEYKLAVMEADKMLDESLGQMGYAGDSLGEKLDKIKEDILSDTEGIRKVHSISNAIAHDPDYKLSADQAEKTLDIYQRAFRDLELF